MFLAAAPYFQRRFASSEWMLTHFQSTIISVSTVTNLGSVLILTNLQAKASYPKRIVASLLINTICFILLALSTVTFRDVSAGVYFAFLMLIVCGASLAAGLCQNGVFSYVTGFGVGEYTQAIMTGQAVAGILPCIAQIVAVLSVAEIDAKEAKQESSKSAFAYFSTATVVSLLALLAFLALLKRRAGSTEVKASTESIEGTEENEYAERKVVGPWTLFQKLRWIAMAVFICFAVTMQFPVFTQEILSVRPEDTAPRILQPACFIPLAFLFWNTGDLAGRLLTLVSKLTLFRHPRFTFLVSLARFVFIPLYLLCNIKGRGAIVSSDIFYLFVVQFLFGLTNGYIGSTCMIGAGEWVEPEEREAAGGFMGLMLVGGLTVGSLSSFLVARL